jgi:hypothetical protein
VVIFCRTVDQLQDFKETQHERHKFRSYYFSGIPTVSVNTNLSYIRTAVVVKVPFLNGPIESLGLFAVVPRSHSDKPCSIGPLWSRDRLSQRYPLDNTQHSPDTYLSPCGIRTCDPTKPAVVDTRLRPRSPWGRAERLVQYVAQLWNLKEKKLIELSLYYTWVHYPFCALPVHDRKSPVSIKEAGRQRDSEPSVRTRSSTQEPGFMCVPEYILLCMYNVYRY